MNKALLTKTRFTFSMVGIFFIFVILAYITPGLVGDLNCFYYWGALGFTKSTLHIYDSWKPASGFIYPPLGIYICAALTGIVNKLGMTWGSPASTLVFKLFPMLAILVSTIVAHDVVRRGASTHDAFRNSILFMCCPALIMGVVVWGQWDSLLVLAMVACVWAGITRREWLIGIIVAAILMVKPHMVFALPVFVAAGIILMNRRRFLIGLVLTLITALLIVSPYILSGSGHNFLKAYLGATKAHPYLTCHAYNIWVWAVALKEVAHVVINFRVCMLIGIVAWSAAVLFILAKLIRYKSWDAVIPALVMVNFAAFYLLTNMHERYIIPAVALAALVAYRNRNYMALYIGLSITSVLNMLYVYLFSLYPVLLNYKAPVYAVISLANTALFALAIYAYRKDSFKPDEPLNTLSMDSMRSA